MANFSEQDIRAIAADEARKFIAEKLFSVFGSSKEQDIEWLNTKQAAEKLNYPSQDSLRKDIDNGTNDGNLRIGIEVQDRRKRSSKKPDYYFNHKKCVERLNTKVENRTA